MLAAIAGPLALTQARKPRVLEQADPNTAVTTQKLQRSHTVSGNPTDSPRSKRLRPVPANRTPSGGLSRRPTSGKNTPASTTVPSSPTVTQTSRRSKPNSQLHLNTSHLEAHHSSTSLPELSPDVPASRSADQLTTPTLARRPSQMFQRRHSLTNNASTPTALSPRQKVIILRSHYFRSQTQFLTALEDISNRLVSVPKPARLSALRAELALIAQDLPAEVDIPLICPAMLEDGSAGRSRHHRIVRLNPAEATSLNSAERVPYLLMLEVLREDMDFDPTSAQNNHLISQLLAERGKPKRRLFDITSNDSRRSFEGQDEVDPEPHSVFEPAQGDLGSPALLHGPESEDYTSVKQPLRLRTPINGGSGSRVGTPVGLSAGAFSARSSSSFAFAHSADPLSRSNSPGLRRVSPTAARQGSGDQPDVAALATHMRAAALMLAQLNQSGSKRPKAEVAAIQAKIIASMQSLEEQSFMDDAQTGPTFESMFANSSSGSGSLTGTRPSEDGGIDADTASEVDPTANSGAGAARMENDFVTGGVQRAATSDRDDPSAATFGEAWETKRERIRRSSPYGWMKNWDLVSVIVKTGADLRQEAFACQLIAVCAKIWAELSVDVWVKQMRILVTGESSGLIETITNGVSLHSLKRSLTLAASSAAANAGKKPRIATLRDHFIKTFGEPDTATHLAAVENFAKSLAAYSTISYILQLKDRHNGNILIDDKGHIIHIDFGFMLSNSPGSMGFEAAPFKLTTEYVEVLGGVEGTGYKLFKDRMKDAFQTLRREAERVVMLVELMGRESTMPCYGGGLTNVVAALRARFVLEKSKEEAGVFVDELIAKSVGSYYTRL